MVLLVYIAKNLNFENEINTKSHYLILEKKNKIYIHIYYYKSKLSFISYNNILFLFLYLFAREVFIISFFVYFLLIFFASNFTLNIHA